jgi:phycobilisome core-membrane linker protein
MLILIKARAICQINRKVKENVFMSVKASGGSPVAQPELYRTASISTIIQAEQQDRFLQLGELNQLVAFLNSGGKRLEVADILTKNASILVAKAADKIFVGGSAISYLERPQASFSTSENPKETSTINKQLSGNIQTDSLSGLNSLFNTGDSTPPGFKPINISRYGANRMQKSLRDLDWFLRYLTYAIIAGDPNILSVNIRGLRELIDNACSSAAAIIALREMRKTACTIFYTDQDAKELVVQYFNVVISEFEAPALTDTFRKRQFGDSQGLRLPQIYAQAGSQTPRFVMKTSMSVDEKNTVIRACYRQVFERDIFKAYHFNFSDLESQLKNGQLSVKEFIRALGKSRIYQKQFFEPFVNSRVLELAFKHFLGRGPSSITEFQKFFSVLSKRGLPGLVDLLVNSEEYTDYFSEETVPYARGLGEEPQECRNWGPQINLLNYSAPFSKVPQFITLFGDYKQPLPDQHPYGRGNDPLLIQFGAIFPRATVNPQNRPAPFGKDTRRLLIRCGPGIYSQMSSPNLRSRTAGSLGPVVFKLLSNSSVGSAVGEIITSFDRVIRATYLRVFGRPVYAEELLVFKPLERNVKDGTLSIRDFIKNLAKSDAFRALYWEPLFVCKAIEYIHNRLLGRPTYGRQEINQYFDIAYKQSYYKVIDAIMDSPEYLETFGEDTVPYERYITTRAVAMRVSSTNLLRANNKIGQSDEVRRFIQLGRVAELRSDNSIKKRVTQGVSIKRDQNIIFRSISNSNNIDLERVLRAAYRQIFERDIHPFSLGHELINLERAFMARELTVQQLVSKLGSSSIYQKEFYQPYPNTKVIELGTKHFLGRAPNSQAEIRYYNQMLASQGLAAFISSLVNSVEYNTVIGPNTVPYRRFPTLPAANFPNTETLYNNLTKQNDKIVLPSFKPVTGNQ